MLVHVELPSAAVEASSRWSQQLGLWAIPDAVLAAAPESPWGFSPRLFAWSAQKALAAPEPGPFRVRAMEAVPPGGVVLDVGAGGGAGSLPLVPPAGLLVAVDESPAMLATFAEAAEELGAARARRAPGRGRVDGASPPERPGPFVEGHPRH
jgi:hypothetical protein